MHIILENNNSWRSKNFTVFPAILLFAMASLISQTTLMAKSCEKKKSHKASKATTAQKNAHYVPAAALAIPSTLVLTPEEKYYLTKLIDQLLLEESQKLSWKCFATHLANILKKKPNCDQLAKEFQKSATEKVTLTLVLTLVKFIKEHFPSIKTNTAPLHVLVVAIKAKKINSDQCMVLNKIIPQPNFKKHAEL